MSTATVAEAQTCEHGDMSCKDAEALLGEVTLENDVLRDRLAMYEAADAARQAEMDSLRDEAARIRSLMSDMNKRVGKIGDEREALDSQVAILIEELEAAERDTVPAGTFTFATISTDEVTDTYRLISRITRGPVPPVIVDAANEAAEEIREAMLEAGRDVLESKIRAAHRRRRRAQAPSRRVTPPRPRRNG